MYDPIDYSLPFTQQTSASLFSAQTKLQPAPASAGESDLGSLDWLQPPDEPTASANHLAPPVGTLQASVLSTPITLFFRNTTVVHDYNGEKIIYYRDNSGYDFDKSDGMMVLRLAEGRYLASRGSVSLPFVVTKDSVATGVSPAPNSPLMGSWIDDRNADRAPRSATIQLATEEQSAWVNQLVAVEGKKHPDRLSQLCSLEWQEVLLGLRFMYTHAVVSAVELGLRHAARQPTSLRQDFFGSITSVAYGLVRGLFNNRYVTPLATPRDKLSRAADQLGIALSKLRGLNPNTNAVTRLAGNGRFSVWNEMKRAAADCGINLQPAVSTLDAVGENRGRLNFLLSAAVGHDLSDLPPGQEVTIREAMDRLARYNLNNFIATYERQFRQNLPDAFFEAAENAWVSDDARTPVLVGETVQILQTILIHLTPDLARHDRIRTLLANPRLTEQIGAYAEMLTATPVLRRYLATLAALTGNIVTQQQITALIDFLMFATPTQNDVAENLRRRYAIWQAANPVLNQTTNPFQRNIGFNTWTMGMGGGQGANFGSNPPP